MIGLRLLCRWSVPLLHQYGLKDIHLGARNQDHRELHSPPWQHPAYYHTRV